MSIEQKRRYRVTQGQSCLNYYHNQQAATDYATIASHYSGLPMTVEKWSTILGEWVEVETVAIKN